MATSAPATTATNTPRKRPTAKSVAAEPVATEVQPTARKRKPRQQAATPVIDAHRRHNLVAVAAYYLAERRGFEGASADDDWLQAEGQIDALIAAGTIAP